MKRLIWSLKEKIEAILSGVGGCLWIIESIKFWLWPASFSLVGFSMGITMMLTPIALEGVAKLWELLLYYWGRIEEWWTGNRKAIFKSDYTRAVGPEP